MTSEEAHSEIRVLVLSPANGAEGPTINRWRVNDLDTKHDLILVGGHGSRRTFLVTVEEDEHAQV